jgi:hypothetical protein
LRRERAKGFDVARDPERQESFEAFRTGEIGRSPDLAEGFKEKVGLVERRFSSFPGLRLDKTFKFSEHSDRMFAMESTGGTELVKDGGFLFSGSFLIAEKNRFDVFFF